MDRKKSHVVSEVIPGMQITLCHVIANPDAAILRSLGLGGGSVGIMTITPGEASVIAADFIMKSAAVKLVFADRYLGSLLITGQSDAVERVLTETSLFLSDSMGFRSYPVTLS